jgi:YT521-B-like domain
MPLTRYLFLLQITHVQDAPHVYLFFSVNKSGEFYGVARMMSEIKDPPKKPVLKDIHGQEVKVERGENQVTLSFTMMEGCTITVTPATEKAPMGKIYDDRISGNLFWEIVRDGDDLVEVWGREFDVQWIKSCVP